MWAVLKRPNSHWYCIQRVDMPSRLAAVDALNRSAMMTGLPARERIDPSGWRMLMAGTTIVGARTVK